MDKDVEELELSYTLGGNIKWYDHFAKQFGSFLECETYTYHMIQPFCTWVLSQEKCKHIPYKEMNMNVHCSFICNNRKLETNQLSINRGVDE